jgi:type I restriction enzyme S subunit
METPKLRFKEFDGDWDTSKIDKIASVTSGGTPSRANPEYWNGDIPWVTTSLVDFNVIHSAEEFITKEGVNNSSAKLFPKDTILMAMYGQGITRGKVAILGIEATTNQACCAIKLKDGYETQFIFQNLMNRYDEIRDLSNDGGQKNLSAGIIKDIEISIPSKEEQTKIATFLLAVDEKINHLTQKHQLLSQYKQGMMQKLFSQQIRFKADNGSEFGEWEDKRISEIASYRRGSFPQPYGLPEWLNENGFPFVQVYDVADNMLLKDKTKIKISQLAANQSVFAKTGTLIITLQGSIGRVAKMQYDAYVDRTLLIFQSYSMPINTDYFKYALYLLFNIEKEKADGGIIKTITKETLSKFNIGIPCLEEQTKIANFLSAIDQKIEVTAQQIEQAKQWKKGLLQQMFV